MDKSSKYLIGGVALIVAGSLIYDNAENSTFIDNGVERLSDGGYIRSSIAGALMGIGGVCLIIKGLKK